MHTLYDVETQIPAFFHITEASVHDSKVMIEIPYEPSSYYIFDRGYNNFKMLYKIHQIETYFVVRAKKNLGYKSIQWKRRLPKNVLSDASVLLTGFYPKQYYPEPLRLVKYWDEEQEREFIFITNAMHISALQVAELYKNRWQVELFSNGSSNTLKSKDFGELQRMLFEYRYMLLYALTVWWQSFNTICNWTEVHMKCYKY